jgi:SAM-dependent methyltransferase
MKITRKTQSDHWKNNKSSNISEAYFISPPGIERSKFFVRQLENYSFDSIFEVGCMSGRNLFYIQKAFPDTKISGLDINSKAIKYARNKLNLNKELLCMNLHNMDDIKEKFDVVFSSGVLIHVVVDDLENVVEKMIRRSNKYIMHIEQLGPNEVAAGPKHLNPKYKVSDQVQFNIDLLPIYRNLGYELKVINLPESCRTNGAKELVIVEK